MIADLCDRYQRIERQRRWLRAHGDDERADARARKVEEATSELQRAFSAYLEAVPEAPVEDVVEMMTTQTGAGVRAWWEAEALAALRGRAEGV